MMLFLPILIAAGLSAQPAHKIVILSGPKSHPATYHEYLKSSRLLKVLLLEQRIPGLQVEIHERGWPEDESTLDDADLILTVSDGQDGDLSPPVPFMATAPRMAVMQKQMARGCGYAVIHFSTFAPDSLADQILEWGGGYFDWQSRSGGREWYSDIRTLNTDARLPSPDHPICNGVTEFKIHDEFYFNMRFREDDPRLIPLVEVPALNGRAKHGNLVAWAVERQDGGRGFGTTMGHFYSNWRHDQFRKIILNALLWSAGIDVPQSGAKSSFYDDRTVTRKLFKRNRKALLVTGNNHPAHDWRSTSVALRESLAADAHVDFSYTIEDLQQYDLRDYDFLVLNYCNWQDPSGISERARAGLLEYLQSGGGLMLIHFANGAFHRSLPDAGASDWPEYRKIVHRVWDHDGGSSHDPYGTFCVQVADKNHPITAGVTGFATSDELYFNQVGEQQRQPLLTARSTVTGNDEPLAWAYYYENARVFQLLLGHDAASLRVPEVARILRQAAEWVARPIEKVRREAGQD